MATIEVSKPNAELREAMDDVRLWRNLHGPFATAEDAIRSMLADDKDGQETDRPLSKLYVRLI